MTLEELLPWKRELITSLQAVVDRFNARCVDRNYRHRIENFDTVRDVLGIHIVKPQHPSCFLRLTFEAGRHPALVIYYSRHRVADFQRETTEKFAILSDADDPFLLDDIPNPITANDLAERLGQLFVIPA